MKNIFIACYLLFLGAIINAQEPLSYTDVVEVENATKDDLYNRAKIWLSDNFRYSKYVIDLDDKQTGQIIVKTNMKYVDKSFMNDNVNGIIEFTIKLFFKDNRYKYELTDFNHESHKGVYNFGYITTAEDNPKVHGFNKRWSNNNWKKMKEFINKEQAIIVSSLKEKMNTPLEVENNDW